MPADALLWSACPRTACDNTSRLSRPSLVASEAAAIFRLLESRNTKGLQLARGEIESEKLWALRREFSNSLRATGLTKLNQDVVVPRSRIVDLPAATDTGK